MSAAKRTEALGPWRLTWDSDFVTVEAFGASATVAISQSDPIGRTIVSVGRMPEAGVDVQCEVEPEVELI